MDENGPSCPICGGPIKGYRSTLRYCWYRCMLCYRKFRGPFQNDMGEVEWQAAVEKAAKKTFACEIVALKLMGGLPDDEPRVEKRVIPPGGTISLCEGIQISNPGGPGGEGTEILFAGPLTPAEHDRLEAAGVHPQAMVMVAVCDDCGKKIKEKSHFGPITIDGIEEWCDACDKKPKRNKRRWA